MLCENKPMIVKFILNPLGFLGVAWSRILLREIEFIKYVILLGLKKGSLSITKEKAFGMNSRHKAKAWSI